VKETADPASVIVSVASPVISNEVRNLSLGPNELE